MNSSHAVLLGSQEPTTLHLPPVRRESALSSEALDLCRLAGLTLDEWQQWYLRESLSDGPSGLWAASECGLVVPRQNGKGDLLMARQLVGLYFLDEPLAVHSAHEFRTCYEHFLRIVNVIEGNPDLDGMVSRIRRGAGDQAVELKNGKRLRFVARSAGSGRGMSADAVYLDEAFALTTAMMGALLPTLSARRNPQIWYTSSAPKAISEVLHDVRRRGRAGTSSGLLWAEWAADPNCDPSDPANWARTNPAYGTRISEQSVRMEHEALTPEEFARERLGIPDETDGGDAVIPLDLWVSLVEPYEFIKGTVSLALDSSPNGLWASIDAVQVDRAGMAHVDVVDRHAGTGWLAARCAELCNAFGTPIAYAANGPAAALVPELSKAGGRFEPVPGVDVGRAASAFVERSKNRQLRHLGHSAMQNAISGAARMQSGDTWQFGRRSSTNDITALVAASLALWMSGSRRSSGPMFAFT